MYLTRSLAFLLVVYLAKCQANYHKYEVDRTTCGASPILLSSLNESILLRSSQLVPKKCKVEISGPLESVGLIVVVQNVSIDNAIHGGCDNYIQFGSSSETKWCKSSDATSLIFSQKSLDIEFNLDNNSDYYFSMVITAYKKSLPGPGQIGQSCDTSAPFMCRSSSDDQQLCISDVFRCDGLKNCPQGFDETQCATTFEPVFDVAVETTYQTTEKTTQTVTDKLIEVTDPIDTTTGIKSTFFVSEPGYETFYIRDFCNSKHELINLTVPAVVELSANESLEMNGTECVISFALPSSSSFWNEKGLMIAIDSFNLTSDKCEDYIEIDSSDSSVTKWCRNKTDNVGKSYKGSSNGQIDIKFHSVQNKNSSFRLVVTEYQGKMDFIMSFCPSNAYMKCKRSNKECLSKEFVCDGHRNCPSGEDEDKDSCPSPQPAPTPVPTTTSKPTTTSATTTTTSKPTTTTSASTTTSRTTTTTPAPTTTTAQSTTTSTTPTTTTASTTTQASTTTKASTTTQAPSTTTQQSTTSGNVTTTTPAPSGSHMTGGEIALTVIGVLVAVALIVCALYIVRRRRATHEYNPLN